MTCRCNSRGFSLIENVVAILLISVVAVSVLGSSIVMLTVVNRQETQATAFNLASSQLEHLKNIARKNYTDPRVTTGTDKATTLTDISPGYNVTYSVMDTTAWYKTVTVNCSGAGSVSIKGLLVNYK